MRVFLIILTTLIANQTLLMAQSFKADPKQQTGYATYYADKYQGRTTAYGETFSQNLYTCASQVFPKSSILRVTRLDNGKQVVVRVNDRGPWGNKENVIDLSYIAAQELDMIREGRTRVKIEKISVSMSNPTPNKNLRSITGSTMTRKRANVKTATAATNNQPTTQNQVPVRRYSTIPAPSTNSAQLTPPAGVPILSTAQDAYGVQIAAYSQADNASRQAEKWSAQGIQNLYLLQEASGKIKIIVGKYASRQQAEYQLDQLKKTHNLNGFVKFY